MHSCRGGGEKRWGRVERECGGTGDTLPLNIKLEGGWTKGKGLKEMLV